jgi:hypothetical protein
MPLRTTTQTLYWMCECELGEPTVCSPTPDRTRFNQGTRLRVGGLDLAGSRNIGTQTWRYHHLIAAIVDLTGLIIAPTPDCPVGRQGTGMGGTSREHDYIIGQIGDTDRGIRRLHIAYRELTAAIVSPTPDLIPGT